VTFDALRVARRRAAAFLVPVAMLAALPACQTRETAAAPNVVLITLDTTRADHLGCYGARDVSTPNLDAVAAAGARFETAITPVPITLPSHATILTGLSPAEHGVHDNVIQRLPDDVPTLATILKERGYDTAAFVGAAVLDARFGLARGFDHYDDDLLAAMKERSALSFVERRAEEVSRPAIEWLASRAKERPFLLWAHYFDPHQEYAAPPPFGEKYAQRPYDGEIAYTDHWVGELLAVVEKQSAGRPTLTVVVADHGEGLGEHLEQTHGLFLYDSTLRVPLLMSWPGRIPAGVSVAPMTSTQAILPTVLDLLGIAVPRGVKAKSLLPLVGGKPAEVEPIFLETMLPMNLFGWTPIEGVRTAEHKYVESPMPELYDLRRDPRETKNLAGEGDPELQGLSERLSDHRSAAVEKPQAGEVGQLDETTRQRLAALGYAVVPERGGAVGRSDPKDLVALFDSLYGAVDLIGERRWEEAVALLESVLNLHPRHVGAMTYLGEVYWRRGLEGATVVAGVPTQSAAGGDKLLPIALAPNAAEDFARAKVWYERALAVDSSSSQAQLGLGRVYANRGELDAAAGHYRRALEISPDAPDARNEMAVILIRQGQMDEALEQLERLVESNPEYAPAHRNLGALYRARGDRERALEEYRLANRLAPNDRVARFLLAKLLAEMDRLDEAVEIYRTAVALDENDVQSRIGLGDAYFRKGDRGGARREFESAVRLAPELADAYFGLAGVDAAEGKLDDAERNYRLALRYQPGLLAAEVRLALIHRQQGKLDLALEALRRAREIAPGNPQVEELLARIEGEHGSAGKAPNAPAE
jgi:arylsulfatase A-like enzyme/Tfp pilus assembly protein PilF